MNSQPAPSAGQILSDFAAGMAKFYAIPKVYPLYLAYRTSKALEGPDPENIIAHVGEIDTIGDCVHALTITDTSGTKYKITIEVLS